ncbi:MAG: FAD-binding oxidoreductase [Phycisphaerales bacterium]
MTQHPESSSPIGIPVLREARQHLVNPSEPVIAKVVGSQLCTRSKKSSGIIRHIQIDVSGTPLEGAWIAGQSFGVVPPGLTEQGHPHKLRLYSIASPTRGEQGNGKILSTTLKRLIDEEWDDHTLYTGVCSNYLADLQVGDAVHLTGPVGKRFLLPEDLSAHNFLFIATGTGIAPFRSMIGDLVAAGMPSSVDLIAGAPYETDLLYDLEFQGLVAQHPDKIRYRTAISRHGTDQQSGRMYVQDRLKHDRDELVPLLNDPKTLVYICGIAGMELGIIQTLAELLDADALSQYLTIKPEAGDDPSRWSRSMIPRKLKPSKRMFLEVY